MIDETYEFCAPKFFDFINGESEEDVRRAELWFETTLSYGPSPFMPRIKTERSEPIPISIIDFSNSDDLPSKVEGSSNCTNESTTTTTTTTVESTSAGEGETSNRIQPEPVISVARLEEEEAGSKGESNKSNMEEVSAAKQLCEDKNCVSSEDKESDSTGKVCENALVSSVNSFQGTKACTPNPQKVVKKQNLLLTNSKKNQTAKRIASVIRNPSILKPKVQAQLSQVKGKKSNNQTQMSHVKGVKPASESSVKTVKNETTAPEFAQENQAIKRQKLEEGRPRQILNIHPPNLPHKSRLGLSSRSPSTGKTHKEDRKVRKPAAPFISTAELVKRFQSSTRDTGSTRTNNSLSHDGDASVLQKKQKLTLTRPMDPALETAQRIRTIRVKSSAELEEEMMANIPKFKARPINKKIFEAPTLPAFPRTTPKLPQFQEFHLKTKERANQHAETSTVASSTEFLYQKQWNPNKLPEPKAPRLETSLRARPPKVKSTQELEREILEKIPKFKARPLNKKIFESKGALGISRNSKHNVTKPQEFHFATDKRILPRKPVSELFDKLSLISESFHDKRQYPRITTPDPFHLHTEERGAEKERKFAGEVLQKQYEEEKKARISKATPYPYTTDYPVIPPKPDPEKSTKPEPFQLESRLRHEEELQKETEERRRMEKKEAQMRIFKAQPIMREDPIPVPEKERKPLTEVQKFELHVDHRAVPRANFDKKIKDKQMTYKRYREESESAKMMEEEKAMKQLRRTMVPHARPLPKFDNPFLPQKSTKETTKPRSPRLRVVQRKEKSRTTFGIATRAAASKMR